MKTNGKETLVEPLPGSFRDPAGHVYEVNGAIYRTVATTAAADFDQVLSTGLLEDLSATKKLLPFQHIDKSRLNLGQNDTTYVLSIPKLPFVSYPYEWSFAALKAAALLHLEIHLAALASNVTLCDSSAQNIQFIGPRPVFIDHLSFRPYQDGELWLGHRQFCEQFVVPLLLRSLFGVIHNEWYRGALEGISIKAFSRLLRWRDLLDINVLTHVTLQAWLQQSSPQVSEGLTRPASLPKASVITMLKKLHRWIERLNPADTGHTVWADYKVGESYQNDGITLKKKVVREFISRIHPKMVWDLGCNTGDFAELALEAGAGYVVGFDSDQGALDHAFSRAVNKRLSFLPLYTDVANPTPSQGWRERERVGLSARRSADAILALAVVHHLAITRNIPLEQLTEWLISLAPKGIVEFVPKADPMVKRLLESRQDIFPDYTADAFLRHIARHAEVRNTVQLASSERLLVEYERR